MQMFDKFLSELEGLFIERELLLILLAFKEGFHELTHTFLSISSSSFADWLKVLGYTSCTLGMLWNWCGSSYTSNAMRTENADKLKLSISLGISERCLYNAASSHTSYLEGIQIICPYLSKTNVRHLLDLCVTKNNVETAHWISKEYDEKYSFDDLVFECKAFDLKVAKLYYSLNPLSDEMRAVLFWEMTTLEKCDFDQVVKVMQWLLQLGEPNELPQAPGEVVRLERLLNRSHFIMLTWLLRNCPRLQAYGTWFFISVIKSRVHGRGPAVMNFLRYLTTIKLNKEVILIEMEDSKFDPFRSLVDLIQD